MMADGQLQRHNGPRFIRRGDALLTPTGGVYYRPRVLPRDRWLVSASEDGLYYRVYKRNGWLRRLLMGKRWRCVSGDAIFDDEYHAWGWVERHCVNRMFGNDWHGVGYARWMMAQHKPTEPANRPSLLDPWLMSYTLEPSWVSVLYEDGPPDWDMPEDV